MFSFPKIIIIYGITLKVSCSYVIGKIVNAQSYLLCWNFDKVRVKEVYFKRFLNEQVRKILKCESQLRLEKSINLRLLNKTIIDL